MATEDPVAFVTNNRRLNESYAEISAPPVSRVPSCSRFSALWPADARAGSRIMATAAATVPVRAAR